MGDMGFPPAVALKQRFPRLTCLEVIGEFYHDRLACEAEGHLIEVDQVRSEHGEWYEVEVEVKPPARWRDARETIRQTLLSCGIMPRPCRESKLQRLLALKGGR